MAEMSAGMHPRSKGGSAQGRQISARRVQYLLEASIRDGHLAQDGSLSEEELMTLFSASRGAVRAALGELQKAGVIERRQRVGTRLTKPPLCIPMVDVYPDSGIPGADDNGDSNLLHSLLSEVREVPSFPLIRQRLGVDDAIVKMVENIWVFAGEPIGLRTAYFPMRQEFNDWPGPGRLTMKALIERFFESAPGPVSVSFGADVADNRTARLLNTSANASLVTRDMTYFDPRGVALETVFDCYRADRVQFVGTV